MVILMRLAALDGVIGAQHVGLPKELGSRVFFG